MNKKLYVGGIDYHITEDELRGKFEAFGKVTEAKLIVDRETRQSKGFGFVTFLDDDEAVIAIGQLDNTMWGGRRIRVSEANKRVERNFNQKRRPRVENEDSTNDESNLN